MVYVSICSWFAMCLFFRVVIFCVSSVCLFLCLQGVLCSQFFVCLSVFSRSGFMAFRVMCSFFAFFELFPICVFRVLPFCVFRRSTILFSCLQVFFGAVKVFFVVLD